MHATYAVGHRSASSTRYRPVGVDAVEYPLQLGLGRDESHDASLPAGDDTTQDRLEQARALEDDCVD